uniref:Uncharacterized protein n=1 Tax=Panagrolaimus davidi TaxID=227884 RepID=A0A914QZA4_9BILA
MFKNQASHVAAYSFHKDRNFFKNYIISNYLSVTPINGFYRNIASQILEKVELNLKYLYLSEQDLTFEELKIFNSEKLHTAGFHNVIITNFKETTFAKIAETFPNVPQLFLKGYSISTNTMKELTLINNVKKIKNYVVFEDIEEYFDPKFFINFLKVTCIPKAIFKFGFSAAFPPNLKDTFMESLKDNNDGYEIVLK